MRIAVLAATGATGKQLLTQALQRGHDVVALVRDPARLELPASARLQVAPADVHDPASIAAALAGVDAVVSGLGTSKKATLGTLTAGAAALRSSVVPAAVGDGRGSPLRAPHVVWLSAFGSGSSARPAGALTRLLLDVAIGAQELADKARADELLLAAGASVLHAGPLTDRPLSPMRRTVALPDAPRRLFPAAISRATVAAAMLDEAEQPRYAGRVAVPLSWRRRRSGHVSAGSAGPVEDSRA